MDEDRGKGQGKSWATDPHPTQKAAEDQSPTLAILGGKDGLVGSASAAAKRARNIPDCEIEILPNAGHIMSVDEPEVVSARIVSFLGG